jgi:hypothetical protein
MSGEPGAAGCFCSELSASGISFSAEILGRLRFGDGENSEGSPAVLPAVSTVLAQAVELKLFPHIFICDNNNTRS